MKRLLPVLLVLVGLGAGLGGGLALRPAPEAAACTPVPGAAAEAHAAPEAEPASEAHAGAEKAHAAECAPAAAADPFKPAAKAASAGGGGGGGHGGDEGALAYVPMDKPFVVPVFASEKVVAMVVVSISLETDGAGADVVTAVQPRLRDSFLEAMFLHANSGGFDGSFTTGRKMADLKAALLQAAKEVMAGTNVGQILITEIARQDV